ncbi:MAG: hypothetical protein ACFFBJ_04310, partial [Promethearchaeota archaeon]
WLRKQVGGAYQNLSAAEEQAYFAANGTPGNPAVPDELIRVEFINFLRTFDPAWFDQDYSYIAAGDIGPWPRTGGD